MSDKTIKPKGLSITRKNQKFSFTWKIADADYDDGQQLYCQENYTSVEISALNKNVDGKNLILSYKETKKEKKEKKTDITIGKKTTGASKTIDFDDYYPNKKSKRLTSVSFYVCGNRKAYKYKYKEKGKTKEKKVNPSKSDPATASFDIDPPSPPIISMTRGLSDEATFRWAVPNSEDDSHRPCVDCEWQTLYLKGNNTTVGNAYKLNWSSATSHIDSGATGSKYFKEDPAKFIGRFSYTRWIRIRSRGPGGASKWAYKKCTYANPNTATNVTVLVGDKADGQRITTKWKVDSSQMYPLDNVKVRYAIEYPKVILTTGSNKCSAKIDVPDNPNWQDAPGGELRDTKGLDAWTYDLASSISENQCFFGQIQSNFVFWSAYTSGIIGKRNKTIYGKLSVPEITNISISEFETVKTLSIQINNTAASNIPNSFVAVYFRKNSNDPYCIGIIPAGETSSNSIILPSYNATSDKIAIGVKTYIATYSPLPWSQSISTTTYTKYSITNVLLQSNTNWHDGQIAKPPTLSLSPKSSTDISASWDWVWQDANSAELSWADNPDAWESTEGPQTYTIENTRATRWTIANLDVGDWWARVRLIATDSNSTVYGLYSNIAHISLASAPAIPSLLIQPSNVVVDGSVTCSWAYVTADGTNQTQADICLATINDSGEVSYGRIVKSVTGTNQNVSLNKSDFSNSEWAEGATINLCVRVRSASGVLSDGWSAPQSFNVVTKPIISIDDQATSIITQNVIIDEDTSEVIESLPCVTDFPITVVYTGASSNDTVTASIVRREAFYDETPDEDIFHGFKDETIVYGVTAETQGTITIEKDDLLRKLDDGGKYTLKVLLTDSYGQTAEDFRDFDVHWEHQAKMPTAIVQIDPEEYICKITPNPPELDPGEEYDYSEDKCDIYRLSVDKPQLVYENAEFGTMYVDPFPSLGSFGGHRIVYKTKNGDYTTKDNQYAWEDYTSDQDDILDVFATIIDFNDDKVVLPYDLSLSTKWNKDFKETKYLGGTIRGDWNPGVSRTSTIRTRVIVEEDPDTVSAMRRLGSYAGVCNIRTPDGASYHANVDVSEEREEKWINRLTSFSLDITRVDTDGDLDGMTYEQWIGGGE